MKKQTIISALLFIIFSAGIYIFLFKHFKNTKNISSMQLGSIKYFINNKYFILLILNLFLYFLFDGLRLFFILKTLSKSLNFFFIIKLVFLNILISNITPFSSGGGFIQIYYFNKKGVSIGESIAITSIRTVLAMFFFLLSSPIILWINKDIEKIISIKSVFIYASGFMIVYSFIFLLIFKKIIWIKKVLFIFFKKLYRLRLLNYKKYRKYILKTFNELNFLSIGLKKFINGSKIYLFLSILSTIIFLFILLSFTPLLLKLFNLKFNLVNVFEFQIILIFMMYFIPTPGSSGVAEAGFAYLFSFIAPTILIPELTILWRTFTIYIGMLIAIIILSIDFLKNIKRNSQINQDLKI